MNLLILGGTGAMGSHLTEILSKQKCMTNIFVTSRSAKECKDCVTFLKGNAHDIPFLKSALKLYQWDAIVDFMTYTTEEFQQRVNLLLSSTKQYIFLSSSRVYANCNTYLTEDSPRLLDVCGDNSYLATDEYALRKARQENILKKNSKKNWTVIRPYVTFSEYRLQLSPLEKEFWLYRALKGRTIVFSKDLANKITTITYGYDVARGIASLINCKEALGESFHVVGNESFEWSEILSFYLDAIEAQTGKRPKVKMVDKWKPYLGGNHYQVKWDRIYDRLFDNTKINHYIDTDTFMPIRNSINCCISDFIMKPQFKPINWGCEARKDRLTKEWASFSEIKGVWHKIMYYVVRFGIC